MLLRLLIRKHGIADALGLVLLGALLNSGAVSEGTDANFRVYFVLNALVLLWLLRRFGLLSIVVAIQAEFILVSQTPLSSWDSWYIGWSLLPSVLIVSVAAWALWVILSAQRTPSTDSATS